MIRSSLSRHVASGISPEDTIRLYERCPDHGVAVLRLEWLDEMERAFVERLHAEQIARMKRELMVDTNIVRVTHG